MGTLISVIIGAAGLGISFLLQIPLALFSTSETSKVDFLPGLLGKYLVGWEFGGVIILIVVSILSFYFLKKFPYIGQISNILIVVWVSLVIIYLLYKIVASFI